MVKLGTKVRDRITGFEGIVTGYVRYLSGCNQGLVAPRIGAGGEFRESLWFDEQRLDAVEGSSKPVELENGNRPGADRPAPIR